MYIRFDIDQPGEFYQIKTAIEHWAQVRGLSITQKTIWKKNNQHHRVCLPQNADYTLFVLTWPESAATYSIINP